MSRTIDYLFEDPEISSQKFTLLTIIGPHMPQKCDIWGIKVRGNYSSMEEANSACNRLKAIDPDYTIFVADVGKFLPLVVNPGSIKREFQDERLNDLAKAHLENQEKAKEQFESRRNQDIKENIKRNRGEVKELPVAVYNSIETIKNIITDYNNKIKDYQEKLAESTEQFSKYTVQEQEDAINEFNGIIEKQRLDSTSERPSD